MFDPRLPSTRSRHARRGDRHAQDAYTRWRDGIAGLDATQLAAPIGPRGSFADDPFGALVLHVSRETMHHGGEIGVLRDLYRDGFAH